MWPDLGIAGAIWIASPSTCTFGTLIDSNERKSTSHHLLLAVITPACAAMAPARCGGITLSTSAFTSSPNSNFAVIVATSTPVSCVVGTVFDDALVVLVPGLHEEALLRRDVLVGIEDQHLAARLGLLEVPRHLARPLVRARAGICRARAGSRSRRRRRRAWPRAGGATPPFAGRPSTRAGPSTALPRCRVPAPRCRACPRRARGSGDRRAGPPGCRCARSRATGSTPCAVSKITLMPRLRKRVVAHREVGERLAAAEHEIGQRAGDEGGIRLHQRDVERAVAPQVEVLGRGGAAVAAAHDDHARTVARGQAARSRRAARPQGPPRRATFRKSRRVRNAGSASIMFDSFMVGSLMASAPRTSRPSRRSAGRSSPWRAAA